MVKGIKSPDRILVLGTSNKPWVSRGRQLTRAYQRHVFVPPMDYGSRSLMWHKLIMAHNGVDRNFEVLVSVSPQLIHELFRVVTLNSNVSPSR